MSDYREVEIIVIVVGDKYNPTTDEQGNMVISLRRKKLFPERLPLNEISIALSQKIQELEDSYD